MIKDGQSENVSLKIKISESGSSYGHLDITQVQVVLLLFSIILHTHAFETCIRIHTFLKRTTNALTSLLFENISLCN